MPIKFRHTLAAIGLAQLAACGPSPADDPLHLTGPANAFYATDLAECRTQVAKFDTKLVSKGATSGALIGAVAGAIDADDEVEGALVGAAIGAGLGALEGEVDRQDNERDMTVRCMQNKGHSVVG
ncbi:glycine zipper family protein [Epibacterium ulvae]|uniref:glycine zipper domain-containing protein n=1 Tax=Epibacterium ulvae TaxID=1156985 RepID=UPI001BFC7829|nr:glycine zipper domain-containing protein [Epibacterium ulvae]MBT8152587.1 glycine zipper family protein [Epibacterium ulvae]